MPMLAPIAACVCAERVGCAHDLDDALRQCLGARAALGRDLQDRELVAAEPRHRIDLAHAAAQPLRHVMQQLVAGRVAERVVDRLEAVEVDQHQREALAVAALARERVLDAVAQQHAVGEAGERVVMRHVGDLVGAALAFGDVGEGAQETAVRQPDGAHLEHGAVRPHALVQRQLGRPAARSMKRRTCGSTAARLSIELAAGALIRQHVPELGATAEQRLRAARAA